MNQRDFDTWLETELHRRFAWSRERSQLGMSTATIVQPAAGQPRMGSRVSALPLAGRVAVALAAATIGLGAVTAAAATAVTQSANPAAWGQQVRQAVQECKQKLGGSQHGIGDCVSAFATQHGASGKADKVDKVDKTWPPAAKNGAAADTPGAHGPTTSPLGAKEKGKSDQAPGQLAAPNAEPSHGPGTKGKSDQPHPGPSPKAHP